MRALLKTLPDIIDQLPDDTAKDAIVRAIWPSVIGEHLREQCVANELIERRLYVVVADAEWKREFEQHAAEIIYKLNAALGRSLVERIDFVIDIAAFKAYRARSKAKEIFENVSTPLSSEIAVSAASIGDCELRTHFLGAAAACIERRDGAAK
ncbi:MAG: DciA family protein [Pyrinomonadaceae bacterium]